jgi:hypothetical protein
VVLGVARIAVDLLPGAVGAHLDQLGIGPDQAAAEMGMARNTVREIVAGRTRVAPRTLLLLLLRFDVRPSALVVDPSAALAESQRMS